LAEFYANCIVTNGVVTSIVNGHKLCFGANELGELFGVPSEGFDLYVREDNSVLSAEQLLELAQRLSQTPNLIVPRFVKKGEMTPLYRLLFWFIINNIVFGSQGRNVADPMDIFYTNLLDQREQINLPAIMISHVARITNTFKDHDMGYGFLLTFVFEHLGIPLQKQVGLQVNDEIGRSTLVGCGLKVTKGGSVASEQGSQNTLCPCFWCDFHL